MKPKTGGVRGTVCEHVLCCTVGEAASHMEIHPGEERKSFSVLGQWTEANRYLVSKMMVKKEKAVKFEKSPTGVIDVGAQRRAGWGPFLAICADRCNKYLWVRGDVFPESAGSCDDHTGLDGDFSGCPASCRQPLTFDGFGGSASELGG